MNNQPSARQILQGLLINDMTDLATREKYTRKKLAFREEPMIFRKDVAGLNGTTELAGPTLPIGVNVSVINQGFLPDNVYNVSTRMSLAMSITSSALNPEVDGGYSLDKQAFDPAVRNGEIIISQGEKVKQRYKIKDLATAADGEKTDKEYAMKLDFPLVLEPGLETKIELKTFSEVGSTADTSYNVEYCLYGANTKLS